MGKAEVRIDAELVKQAEAAGLSVELTPGHLDVIVS